MDRVSVTRKTIVTMLWDPDRENDIFASETATYSYEVRGDAPYIEYSKFGFKRTAEILAVGRCPALTFTRFRLAAYLRSLYGDENLRNNDPY